MRTAEAAMLIEGSREEWEGWTEMAFPADGTYVGHGVYREPCVWVEHLAG